MSSDVGALGLQAADRVLDVVGRMAACFDDYRDPGRTEHGLGALLRQRVFGTGMDYEDLNDHDRIRRDSVLALSCGRDDLTGQKRERARLHHLWRPSARHTVWSATPGKGKSGGYRVVTFFGGAAVRVSLLSISSKGDKADLTKSEVNTLRTILSVLADEYRMRIIP